MWDAGSKHSKSHDTCQGKMSELSFPADNLGEIPDNIEDCMKELRILSDQQKTLRKMQDSITEKLDQFLETRWKNPDLVDLATKDIQAAQGQKKTHEMRSTMRATNSNTEFVKTRTPKITEVEAAMIRSVTSQMMTSSTIGSATSRLMTRGMLDFTWEDENNLCFENDQSSPLICALKRLQRRHGQKRGTRMWIENLTKLYFITDTDSSGIVDRNEYYDMIELLDLSERLKESLRQKFGTINNGSDGISLREFLMFFLTFPPFNKELLRHADNNAPFVYVNNLTTTQQWRQWIYCTLEYPEYNTFSKLFFCVDLIITIVPIVIMSIEGVFPSKRIEWEEDKYMWIISVFFCIQYVCGLSTCKIKRIYIFNVNHILDAISFLI